MTLEQRIRDRLATIPEPCALAMRRPTTIAQMGLIDTVTVSDGHAVVTLCLTDPACVHFRSLQAFIADALADMPEVTDVTVVQTLTKLWTPERMHA